MRTGLYKTSIIQDVFRVVQGRIDDKTYESNDTTAAQNVLVAGDGNLYAGHTILYAGYAGMIITP
jgi:hypothetical protein